MLLTKKTEYGKCAGVHRETVQATSELTIDRDMEITAVIVMILQICLRPPEILSIYHYDL